MKATLDPAPLEKRRFKTRLYEQFARVGKTLAHPIRLELLDLLAQGEKTVESLADEMSVPLANVSQHLQVLKAAQLVESRRKGLYAFYALSGDDVFALWRSLRVLGETRIAEIDRMSRLYFTRRQALEAIEAKELSRRLREGDVVVLDVRPGDEYASGHIPGAISIPISELKRRLDELPKSREIVAYCRGPYCVFADEAAALLLKKGYRARRFAEGFPDWRARGLPVETSKGGVK